MKNNDLKSYAKYLIKVYASIHDRYENSGMHYALKQFVDEGVMKDLIFKNSRRENKIGILHAKRDSLEEFAKSRNIQVEFKTFEEFIEKEK